MHAWLEVFGWIGSALVVWSLMQGRVLRFRWMNLAGALAATIYNTVIGIWPFADDAYLRHFLAVHASEVETDRPGFVAGVDPEPGRTRFLVVRGDEAVGVVVVRDAGDGVGVVELDWVTRRFRDFTPGQFVYADSGALPAAGFTRVVVYPDEHTDHEYLRHAGFRTEDATWVRDLVA
jgi:hypothetical protein